MRSEEVKNSLNKQFDDKQVNRYDSDIYIEAATQGIDELKDMISFIKKVEQEPKIAVTNLKEEMGDTRHNYFSIIKKYKSSTIKLSAHDFQKYLLEMFNKGFKDFLIEEGMNTDYFFKLSNPDSFPSKYLLYFEQSPLCRVDSINRVYGKTSIGFNIEYYKELMDEKKSFITEKEAELQRLNAAIKRPHILYSQVTDVFVFLFKRKILKNKLEERIEKVSSLLQAEKKNLLIMKEELPELYVKNQKEEDAFNNIEPLLNKLGYTYTDEKGQLY
ncbi:hypothetical protein MZM54_03970 [[Brevibacterium] frigoritolerans]|nr:hypothetical protein [Peribacillus frigoritolerans]